MAVAFTGVATSPPFDKVAREHCLSLGSICPDLRSCHVAVEQVRRPRSTSRPYVVRIDLMWGRHELTLSRIHDSDPLPALQSAFAAARRYLSDTANSLDARSTEQAGMAG